MKSLIWLSLLALPAVAQDPVANQTQPQSLEESLIKDLRWRNIGNANLKGRISSVDALDDDWSYVVVGSAAGGVFKSDNGGTTFNSIFDHYGSASIGDARIFQGDRNIIWVGTGEECGRNSATWGDGIYKSTDGGKTFKNMGLKDTYTIGCVLTHPKDPDTVYACALGCIWGPLGDRGFFKTTDGGKTWTKLTKGLPDDPKNTGALYAVMDPTDSNTIYVSFWERHRTAWHLDSGGPNGGIFKTTDGGKSFRKLTNGLPVGPSGKIGLAISRSNPKVLMTHYEAGFQPERGDADYDDMTKLGAGIYRSEDGGESWKYMNRYWSRPFYYNHVAIDPQDDKLTYHFNQNFQMSTNGGRTLRPANGGGHCWHAMWIDPHNKSRFYTGSDGGLSLTHDGGQNYVTFKNINATQYYRLGVDMRDPYYVYGGLQDSGTSGGPSLTRAQAIYNGEWLNIGGGDGMHVPVDPTDWRTVYIERDPRGQGGDVRRVNVETRESVSVRPQKGENIVNYDSYITPEIEKMQMDKGWGPSPGAGSGAFRWNWNQALELSPHDSRIVYLGANHLFKSPDRGDTWWLISPDLSKNDPVKTKKGSGGLTPDEVPGGGAEFFGTIVTVNESPILPGVIWAGTDDGNVQVTRDAGRTWSNVAVNIKGLPSQDLYISRVRPSRFDAGTCYVTIDGHKSANFKPWVFKTTDYGATWKSIAGNLPANEPLYVIEQDRKNPNLLFVGTEFAVYYTVNGGERWTRLGKDLPTVAVHDIVVHPREPDVIIGTHGRGIWIMDDISALQQLTPAVMATEAHIFQNKVGTHWLSIEPQDSGGAYNYSGENPSKAAAINYWLGAGATGQVTMQISDESGRLSRTLTFAARPGLGKVEWDMRFSGTNAAVRRGVVGDEIELQGRGTRGGATNVPAAATNSESPDAAPARGGGGRGRGARGGGGDVADAGGGGGRGRGRRGGPAGTPAPVGSYRVKMTVNGKTYAGSILVRNDPMLGGSN